MIDGDLGTSVATDVSGPEGEAPWIKLDLGSNPCTYGKIRLVGLDTSKMGFLRVIFSKK